MSAPENRIRSIQDRLAQAARQSGVPHTEVLQHYGIERFLYRLGESRHRRRFVLKGALVFRVWNGPDARATRDVDLLGPAGLTPAELERVLLDCFELHGGNDAVEFDAKSISIASIRALAEHVGLRATFNGLLGRSRLWFQVDVGAGDAVVPEPVECEYPTILDLPRPRLLLYTPYTVIAEKFEAIVNLGEANSRMKDYFDLEALAATERIEGHLLQAAIRAAFRARATPIPADVPAGLDDAFALLPQKHTQWRAFLKKRRLSETHRLQDAVAAARALIMPVCEAERANRAFVAKWSPGGPWSNKGEGGR